MKHESITHYALGELRGAEREDFEKALAADSTLAAELEETNRLTALLGAAWTRKAGLGDKRRRVVLEQCRATVRRERRRKTMRVVVFTGSLTALAACLLILPMLPWSGGPSFSDKSKAADFDGSGSVFVATSSVVCDEAPVPQPQTPAEEPLAASGPMLAAADRSTVVATQMPALGASERRSFTSGWGRGSAGGGLASRQVEMNTETYDAVPGNRFLDVTQNPLSTFSIDVDTASYSNVRRFLSAGSLPPSGAVRIEELVNYFPYDHGTPRDGEPVAVQLDAARCPWKAGHDLVRISLKARDIPVGERPASNLVFLIDVSGSMNAPDKLPLLKRSLRAMVEHLDSRDSVAIVVYAGASGLVLPPTPGTSKDKIIDAIETLEPGGSTNGSAGIELAYATAKENFLTDGNNRVILCTDGDFNVGVSDQGSLVELIERQRASGVFLSVLGFGRGNLKDSTMEKLADKGNGNYAYIDSPAEGRKVLVSQMAGTLFTVAKDVKVQVEFNPARVAAYRLIGYENRLLAKEDFNDDRKDAGEMGSGQTVTILYEIVPAGAAVSVRPSVDDLKYQSPPSKNENPSSDLLTVKIRYKDPQGTESRLMAVPFAPKTVPNFDAAAHDLRFAAAVAGFGQKLRGDEDVREWSWEEIARTVKQSIGSDPGGHRTEFLGLVRKADAIESTSGRR